MSIDVVTLALAKAYADELVANGGDPEKTEQIIRDKIDEVLGSLGGIGGGADWAVNDETAAGYIKNRTHFQMEPYTIVWDGDTTGLDKIEISDSPYVFYKVADTIPTPSEIPSINFTNIKVNFNGAIVTAEEVFGDSEDNPSIVGHNYWLKTPIVAYATEEVEIDLSELGLKDVTLPVTKGVWLLKAEIEEDGEKTVIFIQELLFEGIQTLDLKYIPDLAFGDIDVVDYGNYAKVTVTKRDGTVKTVYINDGSQGNPPIRGTDYWTEADKMEIKSYVDNAILQGVW